KLNWKEGPSSFSLWPMLFLAEGRRDTLVARSQYADPVNGTGNTPVLSRRDVEDSRRQAARLRLEGETTVRDSKLAARLTLVGSERQNNTLRDSSGVLSTERINRRETEINAGLRGDRAWDEHVSSLGLEYIQLDRNEHQVYGGGFVDDQSYQVRSRDGVLWLQDEWAVSKALTATAGLRAESLQLTANSSSQEHRHLAPSLSGKWELDAAWQFRTSLGSAIKVPKLEEISSAPVRSVSVNSPLEPDRRGNPTLQPEKSVNLELALERYWPGEVAMFGVNAYVRDTSQFIERQARLEGARWVERPYNQGDARHWGIEFDAKLKSEPLGWRGGAWRTHLTLPHARVEDQLLGLTRAAREVPRYLWTLGFDQTLSSLASNAGFLLQLTGDTRSDVPGEYWSNTRHRSVLDAYWVRKIDRSINLRVTLQNLLGDDSRRTVRAYSAGQEWQLGSSEAIPRALLLTLEGKW
ncbi:MAG: hypothetical protein RIR00_2495, partial [Pseudomonadota bacterium]